VTLLQGKVVAVSGIGPGLGRQIALAAAAAGAAVVLGARTASYLDELASELEAKGGAVAAVTCDVTDTAACDHFVDVAMQRFGGLDCLVNNAFLHGPMDQPLESADLAEWRVVYDVNVFGTLQMVKAAIPPLKASGAGSVVMVNSQIVRRALPGRGAYATSKAALLTAAQVLARELGPFGIRVNSVVPGAMWGPPLRDHFERLAAQADTSVDEQYQRRSAPLALSRIPTDAECAGAVVFLASELSSAMTGQTVDVNGGETFS
jgi:NAD(P)-dependent dehydrogenase (short-subunit alcohol dehydrogenase family)